MPYTPQQRRAHIRELQTYLYAISLMNDHIPSVVPDGSYDRGTAAAVSAFQREYGLPVTGNADPATWNKIVNVYLAGVHAKPIPYSVFPSAGYVLKKGDRGEIVYIVQAMLGDIARQYDNFGGVEVCGEYNAETAAAVGRFRRLVGLPSGEDVDSAAWNMLVHCCEHINLMRNA